MQDWEYELPSQFRTEADLYRYLDAYSDPNYGDAERTVLANLMLDMVDHMVGENAAASQAAWTRLAALLRARPELHREQIDYWSSLGSALDDAFYVTRLVRELRAELFPGCSNPADEPP